MSQEYKIISISALTSDGITDTQIEYVSTSAATITFSSLTIDTISATTYYGNGSNLTGIASVFTGGTVTGATIFTGGVTANTISATTYYNLPSFFAAKQNTTITHSGTTSETVVYSKLITSGTAQPNDFWYFDYEFGATNNGNNKFFRVYFNTAPNLTGATLIATVIVTSTAVRFRFIRKMWFKNSLSSQEILGPVTSSSLSDFSQTANPPAALSINFGVNQYLLISIQLGSGSDTGTMYDGVLKIER